MLQAVLNKYYCYFLKLKFHGTVTYAESVEIVKECLSEEEADAFCNEHGCLYVEATNPYEAERLAMQ